MSAAPPPGLNEAHAPEDLLAALGSYLPLRLRRQALSQPEPLSAPLLDSLQAAVLFADISGFTRLSENLAEQGPAGAELLTSILNEYFGRMIDLIHASGGDVMKFAGDALLAFWPAGEEGLPPAVLRSCDCALRIQAALGNYPLQAGARKSC